jgi:hypothetical protein
LVSRVRVASDASTSRSEPEQVLVVAAQLVQCVEGVALAGLQRDLHRAAHGLVDHVVVGEVVHQVHQVRDRHPGQALATGPLPRRERLDPVADAVHRLLVHREEDVELRAEVVVHQALGGTDLVGDVVDRRVGEPARHERLGRGVDDPRPRLRHLVGACAHLRVLLVSVPAR